MLGMGGRNGASVGAACLLPPEFYELSSVDSEKEDITKNSRAPSERRAD